MKSIKGKYLESDNPVIKNLNEEIDKKFIKYNNTVQNKNINLPRKNKTKVIKLRTKKIIAREIIILFSSIILSGIIYLGLSVDGYKSVHIIDLIIILLIIVYPIRAIFYIIKWAINILKLPDNTNEDQ